MECIDLFIFDFTDFECIHFIDVDVVIQPGSS